MEPFAVRYKETVDHRKAAGTDPLILFHPKEVADPRADPDAFPTKTGLGDTIRSETSDHTVCKGKFATPVMGDVITLETDEVACMTEVIGNKDSAST